MYSVNCIISAAGGASREAERVPLNLVKLVLAKGSKIFNVFLLVADPGRIYFQRNWFRTDLCEMARSCSNLQQVDRLCKYAESSAIKVFYWGWVRVHTAHYEKFSCKKAHFVILYNI